MIPYVHHAYIYLYTSPISAHKCTSNLVSHTLRAVKDRKWCSIILERGIFFFSSPGSLEVEIKHGISLKRNEEVLKHINRECSFPLKPLQGYKNSLTIQMEENQTEIVVL